MLRGIVDPDAGRFTARMKVVLKQVWVSERSSEYRRAILTWISDFRGATQPGEVES